jgi:dTDP-4-dehydrorhamnose 3,5-epimerase
MRLVENGKVPRVELIKTEIEGVVVLVPKSFGDERGYFMETFHRRRYAECGIDIDFRQDNLSFSRRGALRGLHYQLPHPQAKLVQVLMGEVFDVAVDIRRGSPSFGRWVGAALSAENRRQMFLPAGFAHGFCVLSETALFAYKCSDYYAPEADRGLLWSDPDLAIEWPIKTPVLSPKDAALPRLRDIPGEALPVF